MAGFDIVQWCDFVRGVADPAIEEEMRARLETGTRSERRDAELLQRVADYGRETVDHGVPHEAVRIAHAIGSLSRPRLRRSENEDREPSLLRRLSFEVLFDSLRRPLMVAGTRSHDASGRHLVLEADNYTVDVRLESAPSPGGAARPGGSGGGVLTGQIVRHDGDAQPVPRTPVLILADDTIVRRVFSKESGEFHAEGLPDGPLRVCLLPGYTEVIEISLTPE